MKNLILAIVIAIGSLLIGACGEAAQSNSAANAPSNANTGDVTNVNAASTDDDVNNADVPTSYTVEVEQRFVKACEESGGSNQLCVCVFGKFKERYSFEEFAELERQVLVGEAPPDFVAFSAKAREECGK